MLNLRKYMRPKFEVIPLNVDAVLTSIDGVGAREDFDNTKVDNF